MKIRQLRWRMRMALGATLLFGGLAIYLVGLAPADINWAAVTAGCAIGVLGLVVLYMRDYRD